MSTPVRLRDNVSGPRPRPRSEILIGVVAIAVAVALVLFDAPVLLRCLIALPALVMVPGTASVRLLIGRSTPSATGGDADPLLRNALAIVLGMLFLLVSALTVAVVGLRINTVSVVVATAVGSLALLAAVWWVRRVPPAADPAPDPDSVPPVWAWPDAAARRRVVGVLLGVGTLVAALVGAQAMQTPRVEKYTAITFDDPRMLHSDPLTAGPGTDVTLPWTLRSYGRSLPGAGVAVVVTVGALPAAGLRQRVDPVRGSDGGGSTAEQSGSVTFSAPVKAGLYQVDLTVLSDGVSYELETHLEVRR